MTVTPKQPEVGPVGWNLVANTEELRRARGLNYKQLSEALNAAGRPVPPLGLSRMSRGERRTDVDELVALAAVFDVDPAALLAPPGSAEPGSHPAVRAAHALAGRLAELVTAGSPETAARARARADLAMRRVQLEADELAATVRDALAPNPDYQAVKP